MPISEVPPHTITEEMQRNVEALAARLGTGLAAGSSAQRFDVIAGILAELFELQMQSTLRLETEILRLRVLLDLHGVLDFDADDPSAPAE